MTTISDPGTWTPAQLVEIRAAASQAIARGCTIRCPVDEAEFRLEVSYGLDTHRDARARCPTCDRTAHLENI